MLQKKAEVDLLAAEAYMRLGDFANAAAKINVTRTGNGKLPALPTTMTATSQVPGGVSCVPRVPDPAANYQSTKCGTLFEALKWEKRMELAFMQYGAWYFDSRGWGDLALGTALEWPLPYQELQTRGTTTFNYTHAEGPHSAPTVTDAIELDFSDAQGGRHFGGRPERQRRYRMLRVRARHVFDDRAGKVHSD